MYQRLPSPEEMEQAGFAPEDYETDPVEVWPENWQACCLFEFLYSQWRVAPLGGFIGLDYGVMWRKMDRMNLSHQEYDQLEEDLRVMEAKALSAMSNRP